MALEPFLIFPQPSEVDRRRRRGFPPSSHIHRPSPHRQGRRLAPQFRELQRTFERRAASIQASADNVEPEHVIVLETVGAVEEFMRAARRLGLEWLGEWDEDEIAPDGDFYDQRDAEAGLAGRLYMVFGNRAALDEMLRLWRRYRRDPEARFPHGFGRWKSLFSLLKEVRLWDVEDRLRETGVLADWDQRIQHDESTVPCEVELWFRRAPAARDRAFVSLDREVAAAGGQCVAQCVIEDIQYHGCLVQLPADLVRNVLQGPDSPLLRLESVMFFRPVGQCAFPLSEMERLADGVLPTDAALPSGDPVIALLDGMPMENHALLQGRLVIDDPDGFASGYPVADRCHGTAMASLIIHGDLEAAGDPLPTPLYVRPILKPNPHSWHSGVEHVPEDVLPLDLVHRSVRRMKEGEGGEPPTAPGVRVVNLSVADPCQMFCQRMSPWSRLLDWLSLRYGVVFVVSAGNHGQDIVLDLPRRDLTTLPSQELQERVLQALGRDRRHRRLLAPAEGMNVFTVGALHSDSSSIAPAGRRINPFVDILPSPITAVGHGYRRSVKPDVFVPGGRQLYRELMVTPSHEATLTLAQYAIAPGHLVASPGSGGRTNAAALYCRGTSNAAALATRMAEAVYRVVRGLQAEPGGDTLTQEHEALLIRCVLTHAALWPESRVSLESAFASAGTWQQVRDLLTRFLGYGALVPGRTLGCAEHRATAVGCGEIEAEQGYIYAFPLPSGLSGNRLWKRLVVTLAWFSSINPRHRSYRRAALWVDFPDMPLELRRRQVLDRVAQRGTVEHAVLEGERADAFNPGSEMAIRVNCRADAGHLDAPVPYALAVTLEVAEGSEVAIYDEIRTRIRQRIEVSAQP